MKVTHGNDDNALSFEASIQTQEFDKGVNTIEKGIDQIGKKSTEVSNSISANMGKNLKDISAEQKAILDRYAKNAKEAEAIFKNKQPAAVTNIQPINNIKETIDNVLGLKKATQENTSAQIDGADVLGGFSGKLTIWGAAATAIMGVISLYKEEIIAWGKALLTGKDANDKLTKSVEAQKEALSSGVYKDAVSNVVELKQEVDDAKKGFLDKTKVVEHYNETMGKTAGVVKTVEEVQQKLLEKGDAYIQMVLDQATANIVLEKSALKAAEAEQRKLDGPSVKDYVSAGGKAILSGITTGQFNVLSFTSGAELEKILAIAKLNKEAKQGVELFKELKTKSDEFAKSNGLNVFQDNKVEDNKKASNSILNERKSLVKQLSAIDAEYTRKSFSKDEEEIQALKDKFSKIRSLILDFNKANPKKAISLVQLNELEKTSTVDLEYRQETKNLKTSLDEQKKLFVEYEAYKLTYGEAKAKERFQQEVKTNKELLDQLTKDNESIDLKSKTSALNGPEKERYEQNIKYIASLQAAEDKRYLDAYNSALTFNQKIERINEEYAGKAKIIREEASKENINPDAQIAVLNEKWQEELNGEKENALKRVEVYKDLNKQIISLTREQIKEQLKSIANLLNDPSISSEIKEGLKELNKSLNSDLDLGTDKVLLDSLEKNKTKIEQKISERKKLDITSPESQKALEDLYSELVDIQGEIDKINKTGLSGFFEKLKNSKTLSTVTDSLSLTAQAANTMSQALGGLDTKAGYTLDTVGQLAGAAADIGGAILSGNPAQMVGAAIKAVGTLFSIGKKVKEMNAAARKEVEDYYSNAIAGERQYQDLLTARRLQNARDNKSVLQGIREEIDLRKKQLESYATESTEIMAKLQGQSYISAENYTHGTWFRKAKVDKTYTSLAGKSFKDLNQLLLEGKLEGDVKALVERLAELEQKGYDAEKAMADLYSRGDQFFTGTTANDLAAPLISTFVDGQTNFINF